MVPTVRAASLSSYIEVARSVGLDPFRMLREAQIPAGLLDDLDNRLPANAVLRLIARSSEESGVREFGLLLARQRTIASFGVPSLLLAFQPTPRTSIQTIIRYQHYFNDILAFSLEDDGQSAIIHTDVRRPEGSDPRIVEHVTGIAFRLLTDVSSSQWRPETVHFMHPAPKSHAPYADFFQCEVRFGELTNGLSCPSAALDIPNDGANEVMARNAERLFTMALPDPGKTSLSDDVRLTIRRLLRRGDLTIARVAENLGLKARTLQRSLEDEGASFAQILNEVRREQATSYLLGTDHNVMLVAELTGYASQSAFARWFTGEFGESPAAWRQRRTSDRERA